MVRILLSLIVIAVFCPLAFGQENLLTGSYAREKAQWQESGDADIVSIDGSSVFTLRSGGGFSRDVKLPAGSEGKYALLIAKASAERIRSSGSITDLPYLYGYMMHNNRSKITAYLQGQQMLLQTKVAGDWSNLFGVFKIEEDTEAIRFFLKQALRQGDPHDGSEARFAKIGLFLFDSEDEAIGFAQNY